MIQVYSPSNKNYNQNGDMTLTPTSASVHAILNGVWQAELSHPIDTLGRWKYIAENAVIKMPSFNGDQLFRITQAQKTDSGITATALPIFFDSMSDCWLADVRPTGKNGQQALDIMLSQNAKYTGQSDITTVNTAYYEYKNFIEALNGDDNNSFINRWGGEILFDNYKVIVNNRVGGDYKVEIRYGKNLPKDGIKEEIDVSEVVTRIYPKAYNGYKMSNNGYVDSPVLNNYPIVHSATITFDDVKMREDAQDDDEENGIIVCDTQSELDTALRKKCNEQYELGIDKPKVTLTADMVLLQNTEQYKEYKILETVSIGDTIYCVHSKLDIKTEARVVELKYNSISKKVMAVVLGDFAYNYFNNVTSGIDKIDKVIRPNGTLVGEKIAGFIDGAYASLRAQYDVAKKQDVLAILFENLDEESPLYGALGIGTQGLQISKTRTADGRGWDWTTALTANGLIANVIVAGIIADRAGRNYWNLDTGEFALSAQGFTIDGVDADEYFKENWTQKEIFDKLTNNGETQGIYLQGGKLYINGTYMQIGRITDKVGANYWDLTTGELHAGNAEFENIFGEESVKISGAKLRIKKNQELVGYVGGNNIKGHPEQKGIDFDLEPDGSYMAWSARINPDDESYALIFYFNRNGVIKEHSGMRLGTDFYTNGFKIYFSDGQERYIGNFSNGMHIEDEENIFLKILGKNAMTISGDKVGIHSGISLTAYNNSSVDFYTDLDMHNFSILNNSDERLKSDIKPAESALDKLLKLNLFSYNWRDTGQHEDMGLIAQQVEEIMPEMVKRKENGICAIKMEKFIPYLIKAIQELYSQNESLPQTTYTQKRYTKKEVKAALIAESPDVMQEPIESEPFELKIPIKEVEEK